MKKISLFSFFTFLALLGFTLSPPPLQGKEEDKKIDPKIYKIKNPLLKTKKGDWVHYNVKVKSPMSPEPMKSKLKITVLKVTKKMVQVRIFTNIMGQERRQKQTFRRNPKFPLISAILAVMRNQFKLKIKIEEAKLTKDSIKHKGKKLKCKVVDAKVSGIGAGGREANNQMKIWINQQVPVLGLTKSEIRTKMKFGDTEMNFDIDIDLDKHSK